MLDCLVKLVYHSHGCCDIFQFFYAQARANIFDRLTFNYCEALGICIAVRVCFVFDQSESL